MVTLLSLGSVPVISVRGLFWMNSCYPVRLVHTGPVSSNGSRAPTEHPTVHSGHENSSDLEETTRSEP